MKNVIIAVLVLVVIVFVGWFGYKQGYQRGVSEDAQDVQFNLPGIR